MKIASGSTKVRLTDTLDTRPPIYGRHVTSTFRKYWGMKHKPPGNIRTCWIPPIIFGTWLLNIPKLLKLRFAMNKERSERDPEKVRVLFYSDLLDETNGIANNLRHIVPYMREHGMEAGLAGIAFNKQRTRHHAHRAGTAPAQALPRRHHRARDPEPRRMARAALRVRCRSQGLSRS